MSDADEACFAKEERFARRSFAEEEEVYGDGATTAMELLFADGGVKVRGGRKLREE
ncbi:prepilin-type N-terminal cleavage/methylation domain-containing [Sesbania bispinosa]|nr:prepilin-type N-terminal cleavage/methylation domain-containing [Sesbania bispinosa]